MRTQKMWSAAALMVTLLAAREARAQQVVAPLPSVSDTAVQLQETFTAVAERAVPSVVAIFVEVVERNEYLNPMAGFWGTAPEEQRRTGSGSGVIIRADGVILTNNHVVDRATRIRVRLHDGRIFSGRALGADPATDLAVVKIEAERLTAARMADSDAARVGEWVLAVGAPFGLEATVTHGVLSAKNRGDFGVNPIEDYLQTDASINPGNSGGALVNLRGEVLGINTMVLGRGTGVGFAVPSRIAGFVAQQIVATGRVTRGWTGMNTQDITPDLVRTFGTAQSGAIVCNLSPDGPAARAGVRMGDVIVAIDGRAVRGRHEVLRETMLRTAGERLALTLRRAGQRIDVTVTTGLRPGDVAPGRAPTSWAPIADPEPSGVGITINPVPAFMAQRMGLPQGVGVMITDVLRGGAADRAGLRVGDVIIEADGRSVRAPEDLVNAVSDRQVVMLVRRNTTQEYVGIELAR